MFLVQIISLIIYLVLSIAALLHSIRLRQKAGNIMFDGQGKQQSVLTVTVFILGGIYLITSTGLIKYALFLIAFIVHYYVTRFYAGVHGVKWGTHFYSYDEITGYRLHEDTNELTLYLKGKKKEIHLRPRMTFLSSSVRHYLDREGIPNVIEEIDE